MLTFSAIVVTGSHFILDAVVGEILVAISIGLVEWAQRRDFRLPQELIRKSSWGKRTERSCTGTDNPSLAKDLSRTEAIPRRLRARRQRPRCTSMTSMDVSSRFSLVILDALASAEP